MQWLIFPFFFYLRGPCPFKKSNTLKNDTVYLFRENGAMHGVANGPKWKNAQKFQVKFKVKGRETEKVPLNIVRFSKFWLPNVARAKFQPHIENHFNQG